MRRAMSRHWPEAGIPSEATMFAFEPKAGWHFASFEMGNYMMPVSAYLKARSFLVAAAAALFPRAGTVAIPAFWAHLAIFAAVMIVSFAVLDPDLLRERMRPGGKKPPLALKIFSLVLFMHWFVAGLDRGRFRWSDDVPGWL